MQRPSAPAKRRSCAPLPITGLGNGKPNSRFRKMRKADRARRPIQKDRHSPVCRAQRAETAISPMTHHARTRLRRLSMCQAESFDSTSTEVHTRRSYAERLPRRSDLSSGPRVRYQDRYEPSTRQAHPTHRGASHESKVQEGGKAGVLVRFLVRCIAAVGRCGSRVDVNGFDGLAVVVMLAVHAASTRGLPEINPVRGAVASSAEAGRIDQVFQE